MTGRNLLLTAQDDTQLLYTKPEAVRYAEAETMAARFAAGSGNYRSFTFSLKNVSVFIDRHEMLHNIT